MKLFKKIIIAIIVILIVFVANILISTGFFRTVENYFEGDIVKKINLPGAEDITVSILDSFALISSTKRTVFPTVEENVGGLYLME
jgi:arylesterase/paraoxonase